MTGLRVRRVLAAFVVMVMAVAVHAAPPSPEDVSGKKGPSGETIAGWIGDLSHPTLARREAATRELIMAGNSVPPGNAVSTRIRPLCASRDPVVALRARRIFGAIHGVSPEAYTEVSALLEEAREGRQPLHEVAATVASRGRAVAALALRLLRRHGLKEVLGPLQAEILVRQALSVITRGEDRDGTAHETILAAGGSAAPALLRILGDGEAEQSARAHALWLYALVAGTDRIRGLLSVLSDADPVIRQEAARASAETLGAGDFGALARAIGTRAGLARRLLADSAARLLSVEDLAKHLGDADVGVASLAAVVLGKKRGDKALESLSGKLEQEKRVAVREAIANALGDFSDDKSVEALTALYAREDTPAVRSAVLSSLGHRIEESTARVVLSAALLDRDAGVRLQATDILAGLSDRNFVPALIRVALEDSSSSVRARALAGLRTLVADGPRASTGKSVGEENNDPDRDLRAVRRSWASWLRVHGKEFTPEDLPWFRSSADASRIVRQVREYISASFFHFGKEELVKDEFLSTKSFEAMKKAFAGKDPLTMKGTERKLLERLLQEGTSGDPEKFLAALGTIPFESVPSDLVRLTNAAAGGMVRGLGDRYSRLVLSNDPEGGVRPDWLPGLLDDSDRTNGFIVEEKDEILVVDFVLFDSSAYHAGLRAGDQLVKINDKFTSVMSTEEIREAVRREGQFYVLREGWSRPYSFTMTPTAGQQKHIVAKAVLPGKIGYLRLKMFDIGSSVKVDAALDELEQQGIVGLILDLRNNPGGTVVDATEIVDRFLPAGKLITTMESRGNDELEETRATDSGRDREYPLVVLVNRSSASAAEMVSGSLQGQGRATVIGGTTFGKGIGQSGRAFPGFSSATVLGQTRSTYVVYLTMMRYYLPEGKRSIHHVGVEPDVAVLERQLRGSLLDKVMRVARGKDLDSYVSTLLEKHRDSATELAVYDGADAARYPDVEAFLEKAKRRISAANALRVVRAELRRRLLRDADDELFARLFYDIQEDRALRAGIKQIAGEASVKLEDIEQYSVLGIK